MSVECVSMVLELPPHLYTALQAFLESNPGLDQSTAVASAVSLLLLQNGAKDSAIAKSYLDALNLQQRNANPFF